MKIERRHYDALAEASRMFARISARSDLDQVRQRQYAAFTKSITDLISYISKTQRDAAQMKLF